MNTTMNLLTTELTTLLVDTLAQKLIDEGTSFTRDDINCEWVDGNLVLWITDFDHIKYTITVEMTAEDDEFWKKHFGLYNIYVWDSFEEHNIICESSNHMDRIVRGAALNLGYTIGTTY